MNNIRDIKRRIDELAPSDFEEFCNKLLSKHGYGTIHGYGMKAGTGKTTRGNPDAYIRTKNGKYLFVVYTTQKNYLYKKIKEDIDKALDPKETGLNIKEIDKIICCHTSSNLSAGDDSNLHKYCDKNGIKLQIWGLDEIANQVYNNYPSMTEDLGISISTNQIQTLDDFIEKYDANQMSAPIGTIFQYREKEKKEVLQSLKNKEIVIVTGKPGVGKTRLVLECIREFSTYYSYNSLCVKNNGLPIYEDLIKATEQKGKYLFFVDDANDFKELNHILNYNLKNSDGKKFKIILTVRDYAKKRVEEKVRQYASYDELELLGFKDEEIEGILRSNLEINNQLYINQILKIAEGNPRMAYMAGRLALEKQNLKSVSDSSELYNAYYGSFVEDALGKDINLCFSAGVLSIMNTISLDNLSKIQPIIDDYGMDNKEFKDSIRSLFKMELVEIHLDSVAKMSDQCFSNYILYYVFLKEKIIRLSTIIEIGYKYFKDRLLTSINTIINLFNYEEIRKYCTNEILLVLDKFKKESPEHYEDYLRDFHVFSPNEGFLVAQEKIDSIEKNQFKAHLVDFNKNNFFIDDSILGYLNGYFDSTYIKYVLQLLLEYASKTEKNLSQSCKWIENNYGVQGNYGKYETQIRISDFLLEEIKKSNVISMALGFYWSKYSLNFNFTSSEMGRKHNVILHYLWLDYSDDVLEYRKLCWEIMILLAKKEEWKDKTTRFLNTYASYISEESDKNILSYDLESLDKLIVELRSDSISLLSPIESIIESVKDKEIPYNSSWDELFVGDKWKLYKILDSKPNYNNSKLEEYEANRKAKIIGYAESIEAQDVESMVSNLNEILDNDLVKSNSYFVNEGAEILVQNLNKNCLKEFLRSFVRLGDSININPRIVLRRLIEDDSYPNLLDYLKRVEFTQKNYWLFCYFESLPKSKVNDDYLNELLEFFENKSDDKITQSYPRNLRLLDKFLVIEPDIYIIAASIIYEKRYYNDFIVGIYFKLLFNSNSFSPEELIKLFGKNLGLLEDIYFFTIKTGDYIDYDGSFLVKFLSLSESWLKNYSDLFWYSIKNHRKISSARLKSLWKSNSFKKIYDFIFYNMPKEEFLVLNIGSRLTENIFIESDDEIITKHQQEWIKSIIVENADNDRIFDIFSIICNLDGDTRKNAIKTFLDCNSDFDIFDKISILPQSWSSWGSFEPLYREWIIFLRSILPLLDDIKFLKHRIKINNNIQRIEKAIENEKITEIIES